MTIELQRKSCLRCSRFVPCLDKKKVVPGHFCSHFSQLQQMNSLLELSSFNLAPDNASPEMVLRGEVGKEAKQKAHKEEKKKYAKLRKGEVDRDEFEVVEEGLPDNFVREAMDRAYDPKLHVFRDLKLDMSELPHAANFYDFCARVFGKNIRMPFARQLWVGLMLFGEVCPACTHPKAFDVFNVPVAADPHDLADRMVLLEHGRCPQCGKSKHYFMQRDMMSDYYDLLFAAGQRVGKTTLASMISAYVLHRYIMAPKLSTMAQGVQAFTPLTMTFVGMTATKSRDLLWKPVRSILVESDFFPEAFKLLKHYGNLYGKELYQLGTTYLRLFHLNVEAYPEGPSKNQLRGATRIQAVVDELSHWPQAPIVDVDTEELDDERERANAEEVVQVLTNSMATVRTEVARLYGKKVFVFPQAQNILISSPNSVTDKLMRMIAQADPKTQLALRAATWDISPLYSRQHPVIAAMYRNNPRKAERDFGANPPALSSSVFDKDKIQPLFQREREGGLIYLPSNTSTIARYVTTKQRARYAPAVMTLDAGATNNAFALTITYKDGYEVHASVLLEIVPNPGKPIDFVKAYQDVIKPLITVHNVKAVFADRWNSKFVLDSVHNDFKGVVQAQAYSLKSADFAAFVEFVNSGQLVLPANELPFDQTEAILDYKRELRNYPASHLYLQLLTTVMVGGMLYKGSAYTDDILRALVLNVTMQMDKKVNDYLSKFKIREREAMDINSMFLVGSRSSMAHTAPSNLSLASNVVVMGSRRF